MEGRDLGDYSLLKMLGEGRLSSVYLAQHRFIKKPFILKVFSEEFSSDRNLVKQFELSLSAAATLDHPNIVKVHNGSFVDGRFFVVTDCVVDDDGETINLKQYLTAHPNMGEAEVRGILMQVAQAIDYAHSRESGHQSFAHKAIRPSNILVGKKDKGIPHVYLVDFGVAQELEFDSGKLSDSLEKISYLAPEQRWIEKSGFVGARADIYAFGVLAYYLLMKVFPEGYFPLPSQVEKGYSERWDVLVRECLRPCATQRPQALVPLMEQIGAPVQVSTQSAEVASSEDVSAGVKSGGAAVMAVPKPKLAPQKIERPTYEEDPAAIFNLETTVARYVPSKKETTDVSPIMSEMVMIPEGEYVRGSNRGARDERPEHTIFVSSFALDVNPVTNEMFVRFLEAMGGEKDVNNNDIIRLRESRVNRIGGKLSIESGYAKHPVVGVTWYGAAAYAKWVGKRLPTEAQWEIAARGGVPDAIYPTGANIERQQANFFSSDTVNVMSYPPNAFGLYDMAGNVYEWCFDWYDYNYYETSQQEPENPSGPLQGVYRVLRGGCWKSLKEDMRCAHRHRNNPGTVNRTYGFRCAADVE